MELGNELQRGSSYGCISVGLSGDLEGCVLSGDESQLIFMQTLAMWVL